MRALVVLENVGIRYPGKTLFENVNWTIYEGMKVNLAGRNGSGKSTLLQVIAGLCEPHEGTRNIVGNKKLRIGYLDQKLLEDSLIEIREKSFEPTNAVQFLAPFFVNPDEGIYEENVHWEIRKILGGLGFRNEQFDKPISDLSGGWLLRLFIGKALLAKPELLLLDEPTNHLDITTIGWLENFLVKEFAGSFIMITHDIALQKKTTDSIAILHGGRFFFSKHQNDYLSFLGSLQDEKVLIQKNIESLQKKIEENLAFVERFRAKAQTAARAQSKLKSAESLEDEVNALKQRLEQIEGTHQNLRFRITTPSASSKFPISVSQLSFRYQTDSPYLLRNVSYDLKNGQKVAIIGDNGVGKTTMLNLLSGRLSGYEGSIQIGQNSAISYFGQHQLEELNLEDNLFENIKAANEKMTIELIRGLLGAFGFQGDETINKKARVLSGGEKARLALLRMIVKPINVCLLDEPTNHLDIETKEILKTALQEFEGTVILVSHDRNFIQGLCDRILHISLDHELTDHVGDLNSFFEKYPDKVKIQSLSDTPTKPIEASRSDEPTKTKISYEDRKKIKNQKKSLEKTIARLEHELNALSEQKDKMYETESTNQEFESFNLIDKKISQLMAEWEKSSTELEELNQKYPDIQG